MQVKTTLDFGTTILLSGPYTIATGQPIGTVLYFSNNTGTNQVVTREAATNIIGNGAGAPAGPGVHNVTVGSYFSAIMWKLDASTWGYIGPA